MIAFLSIRQQSPHVQPERPALIVPLASRTKMPSSSPFRTFDR
jgi:hypothetical protein